MNIDTSKEAVEKVASAVGLFEIPLSPQECIEAAALLRALSEERDEANEELRKTTDMMRTAIHKYGQETLAVKRLKASGTFADGVEAAAKWHDERQAEYEVQARLADRPDADLKKAVAERNARDHAEFAAALRALTPPTNRERDDEWALALINYALRKGSNLMPNKRPLDEAILDNFRAQYKGKEG